MTADSARRLVVVGDADDARGFRLAGVAAKVCVSAEDVERTIGDLAPVLADRIVLVSRSVYHLAPARFDALEAATGAMVLVLPST